MIVNFGSINADHVYQVDHMPLQSGETLAATGYDIFLGGKGLNQSAAISRSGGRLRHVGCVGTGDDWVLNQITRAGVDTGHIRQVASPTGHAVIYVDPTGENEIVIFAGANQKFTPDQVDQALQELDGGGHWVLFQNETNLTEYIAAAAKQRGIRIAYSAAPFAAAAALPLLPSVDLFAVNETEAAELAAATGVRVDEIAVPMLLVTMGSAGAELWADGACRRQPAFAVDPVDTTGAGDTFLGAFLARLDAEASAAAALKYAAAASALQVTRAGAATAIPAYDEVIAFLEARRT